ncbi:MAG: hypothetical protein HND56_11555 [Pseudomonadota bacterium]|nr:MAG: hypothetical protein HND56_11555 [Pseudomonadota bacterium]
MAVSRYALRPVLQGIFYKQELESFLDSFVLPADIPAENAPHAPQKAEQVLDDIRQLWEQSDTPLLHPADLRNALLQKYMPDSDPALLQIFDEVERSNFTPEHMTGFLEKQHLGLISGLGHLYAELTGKPVAMIEVDYSNMGGTNEFFRILLATEKGLAPEELPVTEAFDYTDRSAKLLAKTIQAEVKNTTETSSTGDGNFEYTATIDGPMAQNYTYTTTAGGETAENSVYHYDWKPDPEKKPAHNMLCIRAGGDELRVIAAGLDPAEFDELTDRIHEQIENHTANLDLHDHPHPKNPDDPNRNGFGAAVSIVDMRGIDPASVVHYADLQIKANKHSLGMARRGVIDEETVYTAYLTYYQQFPETLPNNQSAEEAAEMLTEMEKQLAQKRYNGFQGMKKATKNDLAAKENYIEQEIALMELNEMELNGGNALPYLYETADNAPLFSTPGERRYLRMVHAIKEQGLETQNPYEDHYLRHTAFRSVAIDSSAGCWMPGDMPETVSIYAEDTASLKTRLVSTAAMTEEEAAKLKPRLLGVAFHNLGGLNDAVGHDGANSALQHMAKNIIGGAMMEEGLTLGDYQIAHYGGAEFQIVTRPVYTDSNGAAVAVDEAKIRRIETNIAVKTAEMNKMNIVAFLDDAGLPPDDDLRAKMGSRRFADIRDVKPERDIGGLAVATFARPVELEGDRAGAFIFHHREKLQEKMDAYRAKILTQKAQNKDPADKKTKRRKNDSRFAQ